MPITSFETGAARMRTALFCAALVGSALGLTACGGDDTSGLCFLDRGRFEEIEVGTGTTPRFTWCGAPAKTLQVRTAGGGSSLWTIDCQGNPPLCIDPPVVYADSVENTSILTGPLPLQAGTAYELCLLGQDGRPATACSAFTP
jgi:hypothetical protein